MSFDHLRGASFRGVPFETDTRELAGGRRLVRHEYPLRDTPFAEDLGRKAIEYPIEAFIVHGRKYDYVSARDQLRQALEERGPGTLIHPSLGELIVAVDSYRLKESSREDGYCTFSVTFVEAGQAENPGATQNTAQIGAARAAAAREASLDDFEQRYHVVPQWLTGTAATFRHGVDTACACLDLAQAEINAPFELAAGLLREPNRLSGALGSLFSAANLAGRNLHFDFGSLAAILAAGFSKGRSSDPYAPPGASDRDVSPGAVLGAAVATQAVISAAEASMLTEYDAADDAMANRDAILAGLDSVADYAPDDVYGPIADLRLAVAVDLTTRGGRLPRVSYIELSAVQPALVVAYKLYGDAGRDAEIIRRNRVRHPGRVPAGVPLEVIR